MSEVSELIANNPDEMREINDKNVVPILAHVLTDFLKKNKLTYKDLERATGISSRQIQNLSEGKVDNPGVVTVLRLFVACYRRTYISD